MRRSLKVFLLVYGLAKFSPMPNGLWQSECEYRNEYILELHCIDRIGTYCDVAGVYSSNGIEVDLKLPELLILIEEEDMNRCYDTSDDFSNV